MKHLFILSLGLLLAGCATGPRFSEIQTTTCRNSSYVAEWRCIKSVMANNPRHQSNQKFVNKVTFYGDKLEVSVKKGLMGDGMASMALSQYVDEINRAEMMQYYMASQMMNNLQSSMYANQPIVCVDHGLHIICQ